jgi:hypothetical protein
MSYIAWRLQVIEECYRPAAEPFAEFTWCLATYACNQQNTNISIKALGHLNGIAEKVANNEIGCPATTKHSEDTEAAAMVC